MGTNIFQRNLSNFLSVDQKVIEFSASMSIIWCLNFYLSRTNSHTISNTYLLKVGKSRKMLRIRILIKIQRSHLQHCQTFATKLVCKKLLNSKECQTRIQWTYFVHCRSCIPQNAQQVTCSVIQNQCMPLSFSMECF